MKIKSRISAITSIILLLVFDQVYAGPKLTLKNCIEIALKNQPSIQAATQNVIAARGRKIQVRSSLFPQLKASTGYSENHSLGGAFGESITKSYTTTLSADLLLFDFGKTGNATDAAEWNARSFSHEKERTEQDVILSVKQAYFALLAAVNMAEVAAKRVAQTEDHLKRAEAFFRAGSKPRFDVTRAEVDVNSARLGLINARNTLRIQTIILNNLLGFDPGQEIQIASELPPVVISMNLEQAQAEALKIRPELQKADAEIEAAKARVRSEESGYWPSLSASGAYNWANGTSSGAYSLPSSTSAGSSNGIAFENDVGNSWNAGILLSVPLFQGGLTRGRISEARATLKAVEANRETIKQSVLLEVNRAYTDIENANARIQVMEISLQKARESLELAQGRYDAGIGPFLEVTDAQLAAAQAEIDHIQAQYDYQLSVARLFKAIGVRTE